jgi:hypothetical protein
LKRLNVEPIGNPGPELVPWPALAGKPPVKPPLPERRW